MERSPADARVAPTAAGSADNNVKVPTSPKRQRETAPMNQVNPRVATHGPKHPGGHHGHDPGYRRCPDSCWPPYRYRCHLRRPSRRGTYPRT
eukprot:scaffold2398_cov139-Isochrysis_galbana.AAC.3